MKGDKLVIQEGHVKAARQIMKLLLPQIGKNQSNFVITIAGESGSGKSEIAAALADFLVRLLLCPFVNRFFLCHANQLSFRF